MAFSVKQNCLELVTTSGGSRNLGLDGLRGIAILLVVASHVSATRFPLGGMVGVTLFFVLSGFLITSILIRERETRGRIDLKAFYVRRVLRLMPALVLLLIFSPVVLWVLRDPLLSSSLIPASLITVTYLGDFFRAAGDHLVVYGHTWSLAVEEQFYIVWPILLIALAYLSKGKRKLFWWVVGAALILAAWRVFASGTMPFERVYYSLDTNALSLMAGAALAIRPPSLKNAAAVVTAILGLVGLVALAALPLDPGGDLYFSALMFGAPLAVIMSLVAIAGASQTPKILGARPLVFFGRLSYGLYLWHEMLLLSTPFGHQVEGSWRVVAAVAAVLLAFASWVFIESPAIKLKKRFERSGPALPSHRAEPADLSAAGRA